MCNHAIAGQAAPGDVGSGRCDQQGSEPGVECQEILEGCLPLSTVPVYPAYSPVVVVGGQNAIAGQEPAVRLLVATFLTITYQIMGNLLIPCSES